MDLLAAIEESDLWAEEERGADVEDDDEGPHVEEDGANVEEDCYQ